MNHFRSVVIVALVLAFSGVRVGIAQEAETETETNKGPLGLELTSGSLVTGTILDEAIGNGELSGEAGVYFEGTSISDGAPISWVYGNGMWDDYSFGTGYIEMAFESAAVNGLQFGIGGIAVNQLWWDHDNLFTGEEDYSSRYTEDAALNKAYLKYTFPETESSITIGRKEFKKSVCMEGDFHQGVEIAVKDVEMVDIYLSAIEKWANESGPDEITHEVEMEERRGRGNWGWSLIADIAVDNLSVTPFCHLHRGSVLSGGMSAEGVLEMDEKLSVSFDGAVSWHEEKTEDDPGTNWAEISDENDEDWHQYLLRCKVKMDKFTVAAGYYKVSDDKDRSNPALTKWGNKVGFTDAASPGELFQEDFCPLEEIGFWGDTGTAFLEMGYDLGGVGISAIYGIAHDNNDSGTLNIPTGDVDSDAEEIDLRLDANLTDRISFDVLWARINFEEDDHNDDYDYWEGGLSVSF
ncbi:MAG: hypothetical protein ACLFWL_18170 [Candidatus Brocadiia bacterium]